MQDLRYALRTMNNNRVFVALAILSLALGIGAAMVAVISYTYSAKRFAEPAQAVGNSILVNNVPFSIAGVTPPDFFGVDPGSSPDLYLPMHASLSIYAPDPSILRPRNI